MVSRGSGYCSVSDGMRIKGKLEVKFDDGWQTFDFDWEDCTFNASIEAIDLGAKDGYRQVAPGRRHVTLSGFHPGQKRYSECE